ncbi:hypothetical protein C8Q75DRAFT_811581 [Abortiporus biennis]|nr:hypothetical protein C8Q75DRAFT_811581 [Abortiporus biennis]
MIVSIPIELWEKVIDFVDVEDRRRLEDGQWMTARHGDISACALTCRAWLDRSRYHLAQDVTIISQRQLSSLSIFFRSRDKLGLLPCRSLTISSSTPPQSNDADYWHSAIPITLSHAIKQVEVMKCVGLSFTNAHPGFIQHLSTARALNTLQLELVNFSTMDQFLQFLCALRSLKHLTLKNIHFPEKLSPCVQRHRSMFKINLKTFTFMWPNDVPGCVEQPEFVRILEWFRTTRTIESINTITLGAYWPGSQSSAEQSEVLKRSILSRCIQLRTATVTPHPCSVVGFDLAAAHNLETITFSMEPSMDNNTQFHSAIQTILTIHPARLRSITFLVHNVDPESTVQGIPWHSLSIALTRGESTPRFEKLTKLRFFVGNLGSTNNTSSNTEEPRTKEPYLTPLRNAAQNAFPELFELGLISF